ncbi:ATP-binding cassette sub-family A member 3 [Papilio xuthus]|uniref:ATP-binding cassette sub-family A member 3 n=1 Tax=Papilio xuthus TaxID=66420 RepID=A0A194PP82_PAPXU|nr:ATP-binding cassette sub-family A member 3 [Papilio xuthus]
MTILELFTPLFLLLPLIGFRNVTTTIQDNALRSPPTAPHLVYTPNTELTSRLIEKVSDTLYIPPYEPIPDKMEHSYMRSHEIKSEEELNLLQSVDGLVVFENLDGEYLPDYLNYTIHLRNPHHLTVMTRRRDYEHLDELSESFLRVQWAIDSSFIKIKANTDEDLQNITMKELRSNVHQLALDRTLSDILFFSLIAVTFIAPIFSFTQIMLRMNEDKTTGIQEISEMAGASSLMICLSQLVNSFPPSLMMGVGSSIVCQLLDIEANPFITFTGWFLHYMTVIAFAFVLSYITKTIWYTVSISMLAYLATWFPAIIIEVGSFTIIGLILKGLLPHAPFIWFIHQIFVASELGVGIDFSTWSGEFHRFDDGSRSGSIRLSFIMQFLQIIMCFLLTFYLELVRPRKFGIQRPWHFLCQKGYWEKPQMTECDNLMKINQDPAYEKFFQQPPEPAIQAVDIVNLQKMYRTNTGATIYAVDNISARFYEGEITVIIGHNGAGKSTLISIIAGMLRQTSGNVYINGLDTLTRQVDLRRKVAICPQSNTLYPDLTVREHLMFFCMMRGDSMEKAQDYAEEVMKQLDLYSKETWTPEKMSHGMLRRLQFGCTLCGEANLLLLDEPTSGLDVEARREIWDILLTLRGHRTVIMSTHYMDEADILADRILGLHSGIIRCYATPEYLKKAIGAGFRVSITTRQLPDLHKICSVMREMSPDAELSDKILRTLVYEISPATDMECLLNKLEACRSKLDIESIGIGTVTMEEVFMK